MDRATPPNVPHRRLNALTGRYVLVSPHRTQRPWQGKVEAPVRETRPTYDPTCYLCPGNARAGGVRNPPYESTFVFVNDFAALLPDPPALEPPTGDPILQWEPVRGESRVICFSPRHDLTLAEMDHAALCEVVALWVEQLGELGERYRWVQIFESKGAIVGASNPHPHGQIWASDFLPNEARAEDAQQRRYWEAHGRPLLVDYAALERGGERAVVENAHWLVVVPFWAYWPFETLVLPKRHVLRLTDLTDEERGALADILKRMLVRFDNLFETSFPYLSGWHGAPTGAGYDEDVRHWQLHAHFYPPLLRSASVQKFVASYEWLAEAQRDLSAEAAAARLRELPERHYRAR
ncbi:UDP-glucose--hexose-1-phosphate uridylyltransferase [Truepera radiovictrix]|uniref:Galactose-1-phosphate uridylyltransferase n=1 Tax=Truepera radiovictrix (strain DSM 17093 / CIP 108686 / LMG 22925 / RQ-24) TaxID=649638 RepID=D7CV89_TRURR|nr:UDP-glucose--hexose-1-phosphate uridylyltransferase [Truepera radiovictrix]ADI14117.1 galactose-1-phosphate uridylyltransferase [Truepera radiovictrix DSM 17093]WMT57322.1 UDP-glucose--hexose-1-phosphate uridylyltransferase [Truepera radiovictrix]